MFNYDPRAFTGADTTTDPNAKPALTTPPAAPAEPSFFEKNKYLIAGGVVVAGVAGYMLLKKDKGSDHRPSSSVGGYHRDSFAGIQHAARRRY